MKDSTREILTRSSGAVISIGLRIIIYTFLVTVLIAGIKNSYDFGHQIFYDSSVDEAPGRDVTIQISEKMNIRDTGTLLQNKGLIENKWSFIVQKYFFEYNIKPGTYVLNTSQTSRQMLEILDEGMPGTE